MSASTHTLGVLVLWMAGCSSPSALHDAGSPRPDTDAQIVHAADSGDPRLDGAPEGEWREFVLRIENIASEAFPTALSPGVWVAHSTPDPLFRVGAPDRGEGLEALAEDGDPSALAAHLDPASSGVFDTPRGSATPSPARPGEAYELVVRASPRHSKLSFATMVMESNDVFVAPSGDGIPLFDDAGRPLGPRDVTAELSLFNCGTEIDQAPGQGSMQAPRQPGPGRGADEGTVRRFVASTRALPLARDLVELRVSEDGGRFTISLENVSAHRGLLDTPLSRALWAVHDGRFHLFAPGSPDDGSGLEALAEDGDLRPLIASHAHRPGVLAMGVADRLDTGEMVGLLHPSRRLEITVTPDRDHPSLTLAAAVGLANDAFLAFGPDGVRLLDAAGAPRDAVELEREMRARLAVWDAGTEANEVPGAGPNQLQAGPGHGAPDPDRRVRRYADATNDFAGPNAGGFLAVHVRHVAGTTFEVVVMNTSGATPNPGLLTQFVYAMHDDVARLFRPSTVASPGLEVLAEDCLTAPLRDELAVAPGFSGVGMTDAPDGATETGPLRPGESYTFTVTADPRHRWLNLVAMPFPTNDALVAFTPSGVALLDAAGRPRSDAAVAMDVARGLRAWDAGTEANQSGAAGTDQSPHQASLDAGAPEGDGTVRAEADPVWSYPAAAELLRVTITPR